MPASRIRFSDFELDADRYQLRRAGIPVRLERIPMELLLLLAEIPGRLVSRRAVVDQIWGRDRFIEQDSAINTAIRKLRVALRDSAETPSFIETVPGKGYRFIAKISQAEPEPEVNSRFGPGRTLLAVLPFENLSKDPAESYLSDGVTDELITCLGELAPERLGVMGRTTAIACHRRGMTVEQVGRELGVHFVIEGSVRGSCDLVRINVRMLQVSQQTQIWARSYERNIGDLLLWQYEVARAIAGEVEAAVPSGNPRQGARTQQVDPQAYTMYLKGLHFWSLRTPLGCTEAITHYQRAIDIAPAYAPPYAGMAIAHILLGIHGVRSPQDAFPKARKAAAKARELDPALADAHVALADVSKDFDWDWSSAEASFLEARRLNPNSPLLHQWFANFLSIRERHDDAICEAEEARYNDPLSAPIAGFLAFTLYRARRFDAALREARKAMELDPNSPVANWFLGLIYLVRGDFNGAREAFSKAYEQSRGAAMYLATLSIALGRAGEREAAREVAKTLERRSREQYVPPLDLCVGHAGADHHAALEWLQKAVEQRVMRVTELGMPLFDDLRGEPGFAAFPRRVGLTSP